MHVASPNGSLLRATLLSVLHQEIPNGGLRAREIPDSDMEKRNLLGNLLISSKTHWKDETLKLIDQIWETEKKNWAVRSLEKVTESSSASAVHQGTAISVWRGDITKVAVDAVVNAANDQGLGCFVPEHRCIDNVIHRQAGPRLRLACSEAMASRQSEKSCGRLAAGTPPMVTKGFHLPSTHVIHVTGPQVAVGQSPTALDCQNLVNAYVGSLDAAAARNLQSIAFPCISTGLFGFPRELAAQLAVSSVKQWLDAHKSGPVHSIVFNVFSSEDEEIYVREFSETFGTPMVKSNNDLRLGLAKRWIQDADAVLVCAGAGMSVKTGEMVYTNKDDFARNYPWFTKWGYETAYETMGLSGDKRVPDSAKWAFQAQHMDNMGWKFEPNDGYNLLMDLVKDKDYFVLTSNVDRCFERSGFPTDRIYTPQGDWTYMQCLTPCRSDSVFESRPILDVILPEIGGQGRIPEHLTPKCPNCGGKMFGNVRGGSWYLHTMYDKQNVALEQWMSSQVESSRRVVVIEIGAGFNTPTVTRFPVESFARELGERGSLIRINPDRPEVPRDLKALALSEGWEVLGGIVKAIAVSASTADVVAKTMEEQQKEEQLTSAMTESTMRRYFGHFNWRLFLNQLRD